VHTEDVDLVYAPPVSWIDLPGRPPLLVIAQLERLGHTVTVDETTA
jgi:hypothetical protein